jgi:tripartite-type tricarboxylate transporter receptor subunit TctC
MRKLVRVVVTAGILAFVALSAAAQNYPAKPIRIVAPYPPGGPTDILARIIGQKMYEDWGQPVVVESKPGAGGNVGTDYVARAAPDGYTLLMGASGPLAINVTLFSKLPYDPSTDLAPVIHVASVPLVLVVHPSLPVKSLEDFIVLLKSKPGQLNYGSAGPGTVQHMTAELFKFMAKVEMVHIPYKGAAPAVADVVGGQVPIMFDSMISCIPHVKGGRLRALAITGLTRSALLPDVPTVEESGVPRFEATAWYGVVAPATVPKDIIGKLNGEMLKVLRLPDVKQRLAEMGTDFVGGSPEQFGRFIKAEITKWAKVVKESGAHAD